MTTGVILGIVIYHEREAIAQTFSQKFNELKLFAAERVEADRNRRMHRLLAASSDDQELADFYDNADDFIHKSPIMADIDELASSSRDGGESTDLIAFGEKSASSAREAAHENFRRRRVLESYDSGSEHVLQHVISVSSSTEDEQDFATGML